MANEFIAHDGLIIKSVTTGTTENKMMFQNDSGIVKVRPVTDFVTNVDDTYGLDKITDIVTLTQAEYDLIGTKSFSTLYVII